MSAPICERYGCSRRATYASILPNEIRPRYVKLGCARHYRAGYQVRLAELDTQLEHLLSLQFKHRAGVMLQAALRRGATS